jgi:hypothetical protein
MGFIEDDAAQEQYAIERLYCAFQKFNSTFIAIAPMHDCILALGLDRGRE